MLTAREGAALVVGVDNSSVLPLTQKVIRANGFSSVISLSNDQIENLNLDSFFSNSPNQSRSVDVIISNWMSFALLFGNKLSSVILARDKFLNKSSGIILPSSSSIFLQVASIQPSSEITNPQADINRIRSLDGIFGFDLSILSEDICREAQIQSLSANSLVSNRFEIYTIDSYTVVDEDLDFVAPFELVSLLGCLLGLLACFEN